jgi:hypothetical protein
MATALRLLAVILLATVLLVLLVALEVVEAMRNKDKGD